MEALGSRPWSTEPITTASLYQSGVRSTRPVPMAPSMTTVPRLATARRQSVMELALPAASTT